MSLCSHFQKKAKTIRDLTFTNKRALDIIKPITLVFITTHQYQNTGFDSISDQVLTMILIKLSLLTTQSPFISPETSSK